ncbi:MAG: PorT family protein [Dysgonamonadaceae bacterium]|jgi:hypothetical protein|nr:PorT family protein [Dysgonamonadaceae bacterium]
MKKILALVALTLSLGFSLNAQSKEFKPQLFIGAGGGMIFSTVDFQPKVLQTQQRGVSGGFSVKYISEKHLGLIGEINYTQRGWKEQFEDNADFAYNRRLNYLEMPLMTHIYMGRAVRFIINVGPQIGFLLGNSADMSPALSAKMAEAESAAATDEAKKQVGPQYKEIQKKFDYGIIGGLGLEFNTGIGAFNLEGRYYFGLGDMFDTSIANKDPFSRAANRVIYGKLTYYFPFK